MNNREHNHEAIFNSIQEKDFVDERPNDGYDGLLSGIRNSFYNAVGDCKEPLFTTDAGSSPLFDLYGTFLSNIPHEAQQHYNCRACRNFVNRYGGIVKIAGDGTLQPNLWQPGFEHLGNGVIFILKDCKDANNKTLGLFPELLRSELREVRSTIEAYSKNHDLSGFEEASACGLCIQSSNKNWECKLRVTTDVGTSMYKLDRWD